MNIPLNFKIFQFLRHILPRKGYNCHPAAALCAAARQQHGQQSILPACSRERPRGKDLARRQRYAHRHPRPFAEAVADAFRIRCGRGSQNLLTHRCAVLLIPYRAQRESLPTPLFPANRMGDSCSVKTGTRTAAPSWPRPAHPRHLPSQWWRYPPAAGPPPLPGSPSSRTIRESVFGESFSGSAGWDRRGRMYGIRRSHWNRAPDGWKTSARCPP